MWRVEKCGEEEWKPEANEATLYSSPFPHRSGRTGSCSLSSEESRIGHPRFGTSRLSLSAPNRAGPRSRHAAKRSISIARWVPVQPFGQYTGDRLGGIFAEGRPINPRLSSQRLRPTDGLHPHRETSNSTARLETPSRNVGSTCSDREYTPGARSVRVLVDPSHGSLRSEVRGVRRDHQLIPSQAEVPLGPHPLSIHRSRVRARQGRRHQQSSQSARFDVRRGYRCGYKLEDVEVSREDGGWSGSC
jgi:hypothetical protein